MVKRVRQSFRTRVGPVPFGICAGVTDELNGTSNAVTLRVGGAVGVDDHRAGLRHDEFTPRGQGRLKVNHQRGWKIDQLNGADL